MSVKMLLLYFVVLFYCVQCDSDEGNIGFSLSIGNAIDVFANYGDLSQVTQVVSADLEGEHPIEPITPFSERNIRLFANLTSKETSGDGITDMNVSLCENFEELLNSYFKDFKIEGTTKPWKAFMGDWIPEEIMRTFGLDLGYDSTIDNCCFVLVKLTKKHKSVQLDDLERVRVEEYVANAIENLDINDTADVRRFMKSYGTHYIDSYTTGNFIYQVFKFKRPGYNMLRTYLRMSDGGSYKPDNLRFYFSSLFLKHVGNIKIASGNQAVEMWARNNLRESQYLYNRPSILRLHYNTGLINELSDMMDNNALLGLDLKTLRPLFKDKRKAEKYAEVVENDLQLWEINA